MASSVPQVELVVSQARLQRSEPGEVRNRMTQVSREPHSHFDRCYTRGGCGKGVLVRIAYHALAASTRTTQADTFEWTSKWDSRTEDPLDLSYDRACVTVQPNASNLAHAWTQSGW